MNNEHSSSPVKIAALIVAGGSGVRMGEDLPKQYLPIHGKPIIRHTLDIFESIDAISMIHCVIGEGQEKLYQQVFDNNHPHPLCYGGATRQQSVMNGLMAMENDKPDIVLIHDAARPCVTKGDILKLIHSIENHRAATLAQPVTESLQRNGDVIDRDNLWIVQTPQAFRFDDILAAHVQTKDDFTDDTAVYASWANNPVHYVSCGRHNIKITTQDDLIMAEKLLSSSHPFENITGMGFDVHAFDDAPASSIRLCGIDIPFHKSLNGHSDADVGLHAITDAILGAIADGDIGSHFPPSNNTFKAMDSHVFLDKALALLTQQHGQIRHIDLILMCEDPKIGPYRDQIRTHLSQHLDLPLNKLSIKATTTEKLGFTGRREGIACQAIVTIRIPVYD